MIALALPPDPTLDEVRAALAPLLAREAAFDGWTEVAVANAARAAGIDPAMAQLAFPGGAIDRIDAWFASIDTAMAENLPAETLAGMKVRERIRTLVEARIDIVAADREGLRRAQAILAMPAHPGTAAKLGWRAADMMWRLAGDTATDFNHYSKRALLGGIYAATMLVLVNDESEDFAETRAFLGRRIDDVMRFEKAKAQLLARREHRPSLARFIGRLRYPAT